mmetsp:Transcript_77971/g.215591  ORF Transcript_77971/g.215591 Transcript_77971/m.215591 type:complete len:316 (-) Transcript_77971:2288-3235(-)
MPALLSPQPFGLHVLQQAPSVLGKPRCFNCPATLGMELLVLRPSGRGDSSNESAQHVMTEREEGWQSIGMTVSVAAIAAVHMALLAPEAVLDSAPRRFLSHAGQQVPQGLHAGPEHVPTVPDRLLVCVLAGVEHPQLCRPDRDSSPLVHQSLVQLQAPIRIEVLNLEGDSAAALPFREQAAECIDRIGCQCLLNELFTELLPLLPRHLPEPVLKVLSVALPHVLLAHLLALCTHSTVRPQRLRRVLVDAILLALVQEPLHNVVHEELLERVIQSQGCSDRLLRDLLYQPCLVHWIFVVDGLKEGHDDRDKMDVLQ